MMHLTSSTRNFYKKNLLHPSDYSDYYKASQTTNNHQHLFLSLPFHKTPDLLQSLCYSLLAIPLLPSVYNHYIMLSNTGTYASYAYTYDLCARYLHFVHQVFTAL